jgi:cell shape-determining protein MreC
MSDVTINVDEIVLRKTRQDREQAQDLDTLIQALFRLKQELDKAKEQNESLRAQLDKPVCSSD